MATCIITNCRGKAPSNEPFCFKHRDKPSKPSPAVAVNSFGIPSTYRGWTIKQGPDDRLHVDAPADGATWEELREEIDAWEEAANPVPGDAGGAMTDEERRLEDLKQMATYAGPIVSFDVREPYYLASCDHCGWVGSSELCGTDSWGDDSDVYCPRCQASGADCGKVAEKLEAHAAPAPSDESKLQKTQIALEPEAAVPAGMVLVPADDDKRDFADSILPEAMIDAGIVVLDQVQADGANYVPGVTTDWDDGMVAVAIYRAMLAAAPKQATPTDEAVLGDDLHVRLYTILATLSADQFSNPDIGEAYAAEARELATILKARSAPGSGVGEKGDA